MNKFLLITKINLMSFFDIKKVTGFKFKRERQKNIGKVILLLLAILYLSWYVYMIVNEVMPSFVMIGKPLYVLATLFTIASCFIFVTNILKIKNVLFDFKDYDLLFSLPIKRNIILFSKLTSLYLLNLLYTLIFMVPGFIAYCKYLTPNFGILYFLLLLMIPVVPIILSSILALFLSLITGLFKNKNIASYILYFLLIISVFYLSFKLGNANPEVLANSSINMTNKFGGIYPLTNLFMELLSGHYFPELILYYAIPLALGGIFVLIINKLYVPIRSNLLKRDIKNNYKIKIYKKNKQLFSLYKKEIKKLFSNPLYFFNSLFGCLMVFLIIIGLVLFHENVLGRFFAIPNFSELLKSKIVFILSLFSVLSCTTNSSISLEGKSLWIMKMLPIKASKIVLSKIMVNLTFLIPTIIISATFFSVYLSLSLEEIIILYCMPLGYAYFTSVIGIILNLWFPRFDFDNEIKVIKQSMAVFLSILIGMAVVFLPMLLGNIDSNYLFLVIISLLLVDVLISIYLNYYANKKIRKL